MKGRQRRLRNDMAGQADRLDRYAAVLVGSQIVGLDGGRRRRIARAQPNVTTARRPQVGNAGRESRKFVQRLAEAVERERLDVVLEIGAFLVGIGAREQAKL